MTLPEYSPDVYDMLRAFQANGRHQLVTHDDKMTRRFLREEKLLHDYLEPYGYRLTAKGIEALRQENVRLASAQQEVDNLAQKMADDAAEAECKQAADDAKAAANQRKQFRHDFKVATYSIAVTLLVEHFNVILDFFRENIVKILTLLGLLH